MTRQTFKRVVSLALVTCAAAVAVPASRASIFSPAAFPFSTIGFALPPVSPIGVGGNQIGSAGCVGTNRPSVGGSNGSTSTQTCGTILAFVGPQIGQISSVVGPTIIGSPLAQVIVSAGPVTVLP